MPFSERYELRGLERGRKQGLEVNREVHVRVTGVRFGDEVAEQLAVMLPTVRDIRLLTEVADIVLRARTGDELRLQVRALLEAGPGNGDLRR